MQDKHTPRRARERIKRQLEERRDPTFKHNWRYLSGTLYEMPIEEPLKDTLARADLAVQNAQSVRKMHARKKLKRREKDLELALQRLKAAMKPVRHQIARQAYLPATAEGAKLRKASADLQRERRKIWKMRPKKESNADD